MFGDESSEAGGVIIRSDRAKAKASAAKYRYRLQGWQDVKRRFLANGSRCEGCGEVVDVVEVAHLVSRAGHIVDDHYASRGELMAALCSSRSWGDRVGCHESVDGGDAADLLDRLRWQGLVRLCVSESIPIPSVAEYDALGAIREVCRVMEARDV